MFSKYLIARSAILIKHHHWHHDDKTKNLTIVDHFRVLQSENIQRVAIQFGDIDIDAMKFWRVARSKAHHLRRFVMRLVVDDNAREICVGIPSQRTIETLSDLVAILMAGYAFVPYDANNSSERQKYVLDDANVQFLLVQGRVSTRDGQQSILPIDDDHDHAFHVDPSSLAYIMYTSGSTGRPKGVRISHRALWHYFLWYESLALHPNCRRVDFSGSLTFDASITTTLVALASRVLVVICPDAVKNSPSDFLNYLVHNKIDFCKITPSYFSLLVKTCLLQQKIPHAMTWLLIGEEMSSEDSRRWIEHHPNHVFYNAYGPTEATVFCSTFKIDRHNISNYNEKIPIEQNSRFARFHVVDEHMHVVPKGVRGELCIEGPILADGYHNRGLETKSSFIQQANGTTWYRTGDQVVELSDGHIYFHGRRDNQIKIRGVRVELDEVRINIESQADVARAIVLVKMFNEFPELVAILVPKTNQLEHNTFINRVREHLIARVTASMTPHHYIVINELPYNSAGKIDMAFLRNIVDTRVKISGKMVVANPEELAILHIWRASLRLNKIGIDSNFFDIGGNSLLALEVMDRINRLFHISLRPDVIFHKPTIRELSQAIRTNFSITNVYHFINSTDSPSLFMIHPATGLAHLYQIFRNRIPKLDFYGVSTDHFGDQFYQSIEEMAHAYVKAVKELRPHGPYIFGGYCTGGVVAFEMCRQMNEEFGSECGLILLDSFNFKSLGTRQERDLYNEVQLSIMNLDGNSYIGQKLVSELDHNLELVVRYQPTPASINCLYMYTSDTMNNEPHLADLRSRMNGWIDFLDEKRIQSLYLPTNHRGIMGNEQIVDLVALTIGSFITNRNDHDKCCRQNQVNR